MFEFEFSTATLWDVLKHWEAEKKLEPRLSSNTIPVCLYFRTEISTRKSLETTTLMQIGITEGSAAIR